LWEYFNFINQQIMKNQFYTLLIAAGLAAIGNKCFAQANTTLSNLTSPTAVNVSLLPGSDNSKSLGSTNKSWKDIYLDGDLYLDGFRWLSNIDGCTIIGNSAGENNNFGYSNTFIGSHAGYVNTTGWDNTFIGDDAGNKNSTADYNTAVGSSALYFNNEGIFNTAMGHTALYGGGSSVSFDYNSAFGARALSSNSTGAANCAVGYESLYENVFGSYNTAIGNYSGNSKITNSYCTFLGYNTDAFLLFSNSVTNSTAIGNGTNVTASNQVRIGNSSITSIGGYTNWTNISDGRVKKDVKEDVPGLSFINKLKPVTYHLNVTGLRGLLGEDKTDDQAISDGNNDESLVEQGIKEKEQIIYTGFIAQEVEKAAKEVGYDFSGVDAPKNENDLYGLRYAEFVVPLVKAVQELDKKNLTLQEEISAQKAENEELKSQIQKLNDAVFGNTAQQGTAKLSFSENVPNPFDNSTLIPFSIPKDCSSASIVIAETVTGRIVTAIPITCSQTHVTVEAGNLASGSYSYSLHVDGRVIDTKSMILTR
jgi:hypothetical protein